MLHTDWASSTGVLKVKKAAKLPFDMDRAIQERETLHGRQLTIPLRRVKRGGNCPSKCQFLSLPILLSLVRHVGFSWRRTHLGSARGTNQHRSRHPCTCQWNHREAVPGFPKAVQSVTHPWEKRFPSVDWALMVRVTPLVLDPRLAHSRSPGDPTPHPISPK